jgi:hypothetical protein
MTLLMSTRITSNNIVKSTQTSIIVATLFAVCPSLMHRVSTHNSYGETGRKWDILNADKMHNTDIKWSCFRTNTNILCNVFVNKGTLAPIICYNGRYRRIKQIQGVQQNSFNFVFFCRFRCFLKFCCQKF